MKQNRRMPIGRMSRLTGVSESKLRYYDEIGEMPEHPDFDFG